MKVIGNAFLVAMVIFICGCKKPVRTNKVTFHGRVTYNCDSSGVKGLVVNIIGYFNSDSYHYETICSATTDANGYYTKQCEVELNSGLMFYQLATTGQIDPKPIYFWEQGIVYSPYDTASEVDDNISIDASIPFWQVINFHIKNANPHDGSDIFYGVREVLNGYDNLHLSENFQGMNVDTTVLGKANKRNPFCFRYTFRKNGIDTTVDDSLTVTCFDVPSVDIFY